MALLFMCSFDHYATADVAEKWTANAVGGSGSATSITSANGRRSSGSFRWVTGGASAGLGYVRKTLTPGDATAILGFAFVTTGAPGATGQQIAFLQDGATTQIYLRLNVDLTISVVRGIHGSGTVLGTTTATITAGVFAYLEWKTLVANAGGTVDLWLNGASVPVLSLTGQDTQHTANAAWNVAGLGQVDSAVGSLASRTVDYDDLYVLDGTGAAPLQTALGDCRVDARLPTAAGATTAWTPLAGANYAAVDDAAPDDDTTYTSTTTVGATDTFVTQDAPVVGATLYGVQHCLNLKKTDAGVCTVAPVIRHSSVDYPGAAISPGTSYAYGLQIAATNPGTGAAWTESDFNTAEFGYRRLS